MNQEENLINLNSYNSNLSDFNNNINILSLSSIEENNLLSFRKEIYTNNIEENSNLSLSEEKYTNNVEEKKLYLYLMKNIILKKVEMIIGKDSIIFIKEKK